MEVKFKKLTKTAVAPKKAHQTDAGFDLTANSIKLNDRGNWEYGFGIALEIPKGYVGLIFPRSSIHKKDVVLSNCVGVIDSGYRGEIKAVFREAVINRSYDRNPRIYDVGERIAQLIIMPYPEIEFKEAEDLSDTERGKGGFGSSGK